MRLLAIDRTGHDAELVADRCWTAGATGIWEVDESTIRVGVEDEDVARFVDDLADLDPVDVTDVEAVELAGRMVEVTMAGQDVELWVPATVFGDASHPTTATCLEMLDGIVGPGTALLDVGCGSGALSVAGSLRGAAVTSIDIDAEAVAATADNAVRNGVVVSVSATPLREITGEFDVVVANMTIGSLGPLLDALTARTRPGGSLLLSGLLDDQWSPVRDRVGGEVVETRSVDGWTTVHVRP